MDCSNTLPNNQAASAAPQTETVTLPRPWGFSCSRACGLYQQLRRRTDAVFQCRYFGYLKRSLRVLRGFPAAHARNLDLYLPGTSDRQPDDSPERFVPTYLFSFVVGFIFSELLDVHEAWINILPTALSWRILYFIISYLLLSLGIALSNRCGLPIVPTDLFPRELSQITKIPYPRIKVSFDVICLAVTAGLTLFSCIVWMGWEWERYWLHLQWERQLEWLEMGWTDCFADISFVKSAHPIERWAGGFAPPAHLSTLISTFYFTIFYFQYTAGIKSIVLAYRSHAVTRTRMV